MPAPDPDTRAHLEWLGFIQPNGLVVSAPALVKLVFDTAYSRHVVKQ